MLKAAPVMVVAFAVLGTIYSGIATATEAAGAGALISILICICYGKLTWSNLLPAMLRAVQTTCFIFFIVFGYYRVILFFRINFFGNKVNGVAGANC